MLWDVWSHCLPAKWKQPEGTAIVPDGAPCYVNSLSRSFFGFLKKQMTMIKIKTFPIPPIKLRFCAHKVKIQLFHLICIAECCY